MKYRILTWFICSTMVLALGACSGDDTENNGNGGDTGADTSTEDTSADEDTSEEQDSGTDTAESDDADATEERIPVGSFEYRVDESGCPTSSCVNGVRVTQTGQITRIQDGNEDPTFMNDADTDTVISDLLTQETADKMVDGWDCTGPGPADEVHEFEAQVWNESEGDYATHTHDISGCFGTDAAGSDMTRIEEIVSSLEALEETYYDNQ